MKFGEALTLLEVGLQVARQGWNGKGMWVELQRPDTNSKMTLPYLFLSYPDGRTVPWLASQTDLLESDWMLYVKPDNSTFGASMIGKPKTPKLHWTQTPAGKKIMAKRRSRGSKK